MQAQSTRLRDDPFKKNKVQDKLKYGFYVDPPQEEVSLDEFETFGLDRLRVLRTIDRLQSRGVSEEEFDTTLRQTTKQYLSMSTYKFDEDFRKDLLSHFILRLAFCKNEELRRWLLTQECTLFHWRLKLSTDDLVDFMKIHDINYDFVDEKEVEELGSDIHFISHKSNVFFKVPFIDVLNLVSTRGVFIKNGYAYVEQSQLVLTFVAKFRMQLSRALAVAALSFDNICSDERLAPYLNNISEQYIGHDYTRTNTDIGAQITSENIDFLARQSMPLCMSELHLVFRRDHKLKYLGRQQYGLFLKGCGVSVENAIRIFQEEFTKLMTLEQFNKQYLYGWRHMFGKEGSRKDYTPFSCRKIILDVRPSFNAPSGCPFKEYGRQQLERVLVQSRISTPNVQTILERVDKQQYQIACIKHFEATHPNLTSQFDYNAIGEHPNAWFRSSMIYHNGTQTKGSLSQQTSVQSTQHDNGQNVKL